jgi:hypothetical protein
MNFSVKGSLLKLFLWFLIMAPAFSAEEEKPPLSDAFRWSIEHEFGMSYSSLLKKVKKQKHAHPGQIPASLTEEELVAIHGYSLSLYKTVNGFLREDETKTVAPYVKVMDSGLEKLPQYKGEVVRAANLPLEVAKGYTVGAVITIPAYASASVSGLYIGRDRFRIQSLNARLLGALSENPKDNEVIFPRNSRFKVLSKSVNKDKTTDYRLAEISLK